MTSVPTGISRQRLVRRRHLLPWTLGLLSMVCLAVPSVSCGAGVETKGESPDDAIAPPFERRVDVPDFPADLEWINTHAPVQLQDLRGKFVVLDFWTYCCINCMHVLPELKKLEQSYPREVVVVGVHSAKFEAEQDSQNIRDAVSRHEIEHPVVNDKEHRIWQMYGVRSWPTLLLIDPDGKAVYGRSGETTFEVLDEVIRSALPYYRQQGRMNLEPLDLLVPPIETGEPLHYPGKVLADEGSSRLYIADTNHHRIVITDLQGELIDVIGSGTAGTADGEWSVAQFRQPQGMAVNGDELYVADTENHLIRKVHLRERRVTTIAGTGEQGRDHWGNEPATGTAEIRAGMPWLTPPQTTAINSPWDLWVHGDYLYIAMAGPHQIWRMDLLETTIGPYAGNGREDIVDGTRLPSEPYALGASSFAQPSGLTADDRWLYVADSEGSSVRAVPFDASQPVRTVVGSAIRAAQERLFTFGDRDGGVADARFQHLLGVTYHQGTLYVADTYNSKLKQVDPVNGRVRTLGLKDPHADPGPVLDEPAGISAAAGRLYVADTNRHRVRVVDLTDGTITTLTIPGLKPPNTPR